MSDAMNPIQAAEDVLAQCAKGFLHHPGQDDLREALSSLLAHARTLEAELTHLREPLGDHKELVDRLNGIYRIPITDGFGPVGSGDEPDNPNEFVRRFETPPISKEAAAYLEHQAAELARKPAVADAYWEIVESYKVENAELRAALEGMISEFVGPYEEGWSSVQRARSALAAQDGGA